MLVKKNHVDNNHFNQSKVQTHIIQYNFHFCRASLILSRMGVGIHSAPLGDL